MQELQEKDYKPSGKQRMHREISDRRVIVDFLGGREEIKNDFTFKKKITGATTFIFLEVRALSPVQHSQTRGLKMPTRGQVLWKIRVGNCWQLPQNVQEYSPSKG